MRTQTIITYENAQEFIENFPKDSNGKDVRLCVGTPGGEYPFLDFVGKDLNLFYLSPSIETNDLLSNLLKRVKIQFTINTNDSKDCN